MSCAGRYSLRQLHLPLSDVGSQAWQESLWQSWRQGERQLCPSHWKDTEMRHLAPGATQGPACRASKPVRRLSYLFTNPSWSEKGDLKEKIQCKASSWLCLNFGPIPKTTRIISKFEVYLFLIRYYNHMVLNLKGIKEHKTEKNKCLSHTFHSAALFSSPDKSSVTSFLYLSRDTLE